MITRGYLGQVFVVAAAALTLGCAGGSSPKAPVSDSRPAATVKPTSSERDAQPVVVVTPKAVNSLTQIIKDQSTGQTWYLRVRLVPGGCCGFMHKLDLDPNVSPSADCTFESGGIKIVVAKRQLEMLRGARVDFGEERGEQGFMIKNPNFEGEALKKWLPILNAEAPPAPKLTPAQLRQKIAQFRKMASNDPENELAHYRLAHFLMEDGQYAEAVKSFERTLQLAPQFSKVYRFLGECLVKLNQKDRAILTLTTGWRAADKRGDEAARKSIADLLKELGAAVPLGVPIGKSSK